MARPIENAADQHIPRVKKEFHVRSISESDDNIIKHRKSLFRSNSCPVFISTPVTVFPAPGAERCDTGIRTHLKSEIEYEATYNGSDRAPDPVKICDDSVMISPSRVSE